MEDSAAFLLRSLKEIIAKSDYSSLEHWERILLNVYQETRAMRVAMEEKV